MKNYLIVVECAIEKDGKLLIIKRPVGKHAAGFLSFPGGTVEMLDEKHHWDILRSAVKREIFEEIGLALEDPIEYVTSSYFVNEAGNHVIDSIFYCKLVKTVAKIVASAREVPEYYWMTKEEINRADYAPEWLKKYV